MRIPYPERLSYAWTTAFAASLLVVQLFQHTDLTFALCCFAYIMVATAAFNLAGGLYRTAGAFIFFNAILCLVLGLVVKAILDEPANSNLFAPIRTIEVYLLGMVGMLVAAYIESRFRPRHSLIARILPLTSLRTAYLSLAIIGVVFNLYLATNPDIDPGTILSILRNTNVLLPLAVLIGVIHTVQVSNGRRSMTPLLLAIIAFSSIEFGLLGFSKQGLYTPTFCWLLGAGIAHYRLKPVNFIALGATAFFMLYFCTPIIQSGKSAGTGSFAGNITVAIGMFENFKAIRTIYETSSIEHYGKVNYFNKPEGLLDRLQMISMDDLLVNETDRDGYFGYEPFKEGWENLIPHIFWKDKPVPYFGNTYAHLIGVIGEDDFSTGVSFSPSADAYKEGGFTGVLIMEPFCFILVFLATSYVAGDLREHPAAIIMVLLAAHLAPEGMIPGTIQFIIYLVVVIEFSIFCRYIAPVVSSAIEPSSQRFLPGLASAID